MVEPRLLVLRIWPVRRAFRAIVREFEPARCHQFDDQNELIDFMFPDAVPLAHCRSAHESAGALESAREAAK